MTTVLSEMRLRLKSNSVGSMRSVYMTALLFLSVSGCAVTKPDSFILKTDLPANFKITAEIRYKPATGETCTAPVPTRKTGNPAWKRIKSERLEIAHSVEMDIPLYVRAGGCPLVLSSVGFDIDGKWGPDVDDYSVDIAGISFVDTIDAEAATDRINKMENGACQWLFRTIGSQRHLIKLLRCRAIDESGSVLGRLAGGMFERDKLIATTMVI